MTVGINGQTGGQIDTRLDMNAWNDLASTWRSAEFGADWGLRAMNADYAYALGYTGKGVKLGVMDSGAYIGHSELDGGNIVPVRTKGTYHADGWSAEQKAYAAFLSPFPITEETKIVDGVKTKYIYTTLTEPGELTEEVEVGSKEGVDENGVKMVTKEIWILHLSVSVAETFKAGEAFDVPGVYNAGFNDTHGTHVTGTVAAARDGTGMHGVAFDSTVYVANTNSTDAKPFGPGADYGYFKASYGAIAASGARAINSSWGTSPALDNYATLETLTDGYERLFAKGKTFADAIIEVALEYDVIQVVAGGNNGTANPHTGAALAYFRPEAERHWLSVGAAFEPFGRVAAPDNVGIAGFSVMAGVAKYWTVFAAGADVTSSVVPGTSGSDGDPGSPYAKFNGTSMSAPHATGALGIVMDRYSYLGNTEARDVLLTTAFHRNAVEGTPDANPDAPNAVWGWGVIDLKKAMNGPGQFLGAFEVDMTAAESDVWTNPIGEGALIQRKAEDAVEQAAWQATLVAKGWDASPPTETSSLEDRVAYAVGTARAKAAAERVYQGSLVKDGEGSLTLKGAYSSYSGGTWLKQGTLVLGAYQAAGLGAIHFAEGAQTLVLDAAAFLGTMFSNVLDALGAGDVIDLDFLSFSTVITGRIEGSLLTVASGAVLRSFTLSGLLADFALVFSSDADGSTLLSFANAAGPVAGTSGADSLVGTAGGDVIHAAGGDDTVAAGLGDDTVHGGAGNDTLRGGAGDDRLEGEDGNDILRGEDGADRLFGGAGADNIDGGAGADNIDGGADDDVINGGAGDDTLNGSGGKDYIYGGAGDDFAGGGEGDDTIDGAEGNDNLHGSDGNDKLQGKTGDDFLSGGAGDDTLQGGAGNDQLVGGTGRNTLYGDAGDDILVGGSGVDTLQGGDGADTLFGNTGRDFLYGGAGNDVFEFRSATDTGIGASVRDRIFDWAAGDRIDLSRIDANAVGGTADDGFGFIAGSPFSAAGQIRVFADLQGNTIVQANLDADLASVEFEIELNRTVFALAETDFVL